MLSFEDMKNHIAPQKTNIGNMLKQQSNFILNDIFTNTSTYRRGMLYDSELNEIKELDFHFEKTNIYAITGDQVDYMVSFRPNVNPEIDYDKSLDQKHRLGYYLDILDENTNLVEKWLIVGKDSGIINRYNVLKCNWNFEWIDENRNYHTALGCVRDRSSYTSGIWSSDFSTTLKNETGFIVPCNKDTITINYGIRFMISDNELYPKTYQTTKLTDTYPLGIIKAVVSQSHYNEHTDICKVMDIGDGRGEVMHMLCDYNLSSIPPINKNDKKPNTNVDIDISKEPKWSLTEVNDILYVNGQSQTIKAISDIETTEECEWHLFIDNEDYSECIYDIHSELEPYFEIALNDKKDEISIKAINDVMINYIVKIAVYNKSKTYYDYVEMVVKA